MSRVKEEHLTSRDLEIFKLREVEGLPVTQVVKEMGLSRSTIQTTCAKKSYRDLAIATMEQKGYVMRDFMDSLIAQTKAVRMTSVGGIRTEEPDNAARIQALKQIGGIYGTEAPKDEDPKHSVTSLSDEELGSELIAAAGRLNLVEEVDIEQG